MLLLALGSYNAIKTITNRAEYIIQTSNPSLQDAEAGRLLGIQEQPEQHSKFKVSLSYTVRFKIKKKKTTKRKNMRRIYTFRTHDSENPRIKSLKENIIIGNNNEESCMQI